VTAPRAREIERVDPGIEGLDLLSHGGLPAQRMSLVGGTAGSGKTIFAVQFLSAGIAAGEPGVFVSFEERPAAIRRNVQSFGWDIAAWEKDGTWAFVDASPRFEDDVSTDDYDLSALIIRVRHAVEQTGAKRVALDSTGTLVDQFGDVPGARRALLELATVLGELGVTSVMTAERTEDYGPISRFGFEEFVADNVIILRNSLAEQKRRRTLEVLKLRGGSHTKGEQLFTLTDRGIVVVPQEAMTFDYVSSRKRLPTGIDGLDEMSRGGLFDKSLTLVSGATGTGKSLLASQFVAGGAHRGERAILFSFEESRDQLARNAQAWGLDFEQLERDGLLRVVSRTPEAASLEDHLLIMKRSIAEFRPDRIAVDSLTALERIATVQAFREYLLGLTFHIKSQAMLGLVTATSHGLNGSLSSGTLHVSTVSDTVVLLQYVARGAEIRRAINLLKQRGSDHDKAIREFRIDDQGMHILDPMELHSFADLPVAH
jgi:circadian clock protein KaiC